MRLDELTITLSEKDGRVGVEALRVALESALDMLRSVEADFVGSDAEVRWEVVRVRMGSPLRLTFSPRVTGRAGAKNIPERSSRSLGRKIVRACLQGVRGIESAPTMPAHFNEEALDAARKLAKVSENQGPSLTLSSNASGTVTLTENAVRNIEEVRAKARLYVDFATIEGQLEVVSAHGRRSFFVWEALTNQRVECFGTDEHFKQALLLIEKRVAVAGRVSYRNHVPKSIQVESMSGMPDIGELPQPKDIGPINITDGLTSEEHVRRLRNA